MLSDGPKRLLKADAVRSLDSKVAFNFEDFRRRCDEYLEQVRAQGRHILEEADRNAKSGQREVFDKARQAGTTDGLRDAQRQIEQKAETLATAMVAERLETALPALARAAEALDHERDRWIAEWESAAIRLSIAIAEKIIRRELNRNPEVARELITEALQLAAGSPHIKVRMNPDDLRTLKQDIDRILQQAAASSHATVVADDEMPPGGCIAETQNGIVDARLETQLERIADELLHVTL